MKHTRAILAAAGLLIVTGTIGTAQADNDTNRVTLYTSAIHTGVIACNAINVSKKKLTITISIIDAATGKTRTDTSTPDPQTTNPHMPEATNDVGSPTDSNEGYCVFEVSGTTNRDDVRAIQNAVLAGTRSVDGGNTFFPFFITRVLEAH
jgi:hypothetical protein